MGLFQMIPAISSSEGIPYVYLPLSFIIVVTAIKDIVEDIKRHRSDARENNYPTEKYSKGAFVPAKSAEI
jgi:phospholipid-transporting ATPase